MAYFYSVHDRLRETTKLMDEGDLIELLYNQRPSDEPDRYKQIHFILNRFDSAVKGSINETGKDYDGFRFFITIHSGRIV